MIGIYRIVNQATDRTYIGSSVNMRERLNKHRRQLRHGTHGNTRLQRSWNKHGHEPFVFEVLVQCVRDVLEQREQEFIDAYYEHGLPLYNLMPSAGSRTGFRYVP